MKLLIIFVCLITNCHAQFDPTTICDGYWNFVKQFHTNETSGSINYADRTKDGTMVNFEDDDFTENGLNFESSKSQYITVGNNYNIGVGDASLWAIVSQNGYISQSFIGKRGASGNYYAINGNAAGWAIIGWNGGSISGGVDLTSSYHLYLAIRSEGVWYLYVDNVLVGTPTADSDDVSTSNVFQIGRVITTAYLNSPMAACGVNSTYAYTENERNNLFTFSQTVFDADTYKSSNISITFPTDPTDPTD